jgi:hypothetical protein
MDPARFDRLTQTLSTAGSRRAVLAAVGITFALAQGQSASADPTCAANGARCGRETDLPCCSGWCKRKRGSHTKVCRQADHEGVCTVEENICGGNVIRCGDTVAGPSGPSCDCYVTTTGRSFCGEEAKSETCDCTSDRACEQQVGKGAKCVNDSCSSCAQSTICATPCTTLDPVL